MEAQSPTIRNAIGWSAGPVANPKEQFMTNVSSIVHFHEGHAGMKQWLGGKGASLAEMTRAGLPVPPGFTVTTNVCRAFYENGNQLPEGLMPDIRNAILRIEQLKSQRFGDERNPLLFSVRSGSVTSMPGMMDTILNLGLNDATVLGLSGETKNARFAFDCYRRFIQMFGNVVFGVESIHFELLLHKLKQKYGYQHDRDVAAEAWTELIESYKMLIKNHTGNVFPQDVYIQLQLAVEAVFRSWNNPRAITYRNAYRIPDEQGTAVTIQSMVFGNKGDDCGTGVLFTRNPSTGEKRLYGEYLINAQGEDVVAGIRTPLPINEMNREMPHIYSQLTDIAKQLELLNKDVQDIEFTVEQNKLFILQTRNGKRTAQAAIKIAVDLVDEGIILAEEALIRIEMEHLDQLLHRAIDSEQQLDTIAKGLNASPGAASGRAVFDADTAVDWKLAGHKVILVCAETSPDDIHGVIASEGVLTSRGGMTSHAAVVARGMGKPCVCGCEEIRIDKTNRHFYVAGPGGLEENCRKVDEGDWITLDGSTGRVILGTVTLKEPEMTGELTRLLQFADGIRRLKVLANADNPEDARKARQFGAEGIGLCRTEHMFMSSARLPVVQSMILAEHQAERQHSLDQLLPMQQEDFEGIFAAMEGLPVNIRLLDPPLHEFLPKLELLQQRQRESANKDEETNKLIRKVQSLHEVNPMLGQRGCRLGIVVPEIYEMQLKAIFKAILACKEKGMKVRPEIMIPLVGHVNELKRVRELADRVAADILGEDHHVDYKVGTMIEVPRAALTADQIAKEADFFSFGTNDLTQMTFGYSRDDAEGKFLSCYVDQQILPDNPFQVLDAEGVGQLIEIALHKGRKANPALKTGVCGEHGGDPRSIRFCHSAGLDYISCSPYRVPMARIAAAQALLTID